MPTATIYFDDEEDTKIEDYKKRWKTSKHETVKKMVRDFQEKK